MVAKHSLTKRLMYSAIIISVVYYIVFYAPFFFFLVFNAVLIGIGLYEFFTLTENIGIKPNKHLGIALGVLFPLFIYFPGESLVFAAAILILSFLNFRYPEKHTGFINTATTLFGLLYMGLFFSYFTKLRFLPDGRMWVAYVIWVTKMGDAGAYFIGTSFGKRKLFSQISPNKTVEGAAGGLIFSIVVSLFFKPFITHMSIIQLLVLGVLLGFLGQVGDLTESLIKRECEAKDSGTIPGLGGILDIMDSLLFTVPFLYYYVHVLLQL